ncbi:hypothetical protein GDO86_008775 [Hymenochirus boettgeri]|uniref:Uncharacterized protein n=1 Tax=Hymenochirus boettgeri TaxID=247094 RepID=A0A8T2J324_9PIPI|nr:hypothetical protein GDO86_008775 [Hymenochirus boettgeri]
MRRTAWLMMEVPLVWPWQVCWAYFILSTLSCPVISFQPFTHQTCAFKLQFGLSGLWLNWIPALLLTVKTQTGFY